MMNHKALINRKKQKLIVGNWKMNGDGARNAVLLSGILLGLDNYPLIQSQLAVCVPFPYLAQCEALLKGSPVSWGAQDISKHSHGAYTGEVSATMLNDWHCQYAIVGHSERRTYHHESDTLVAQKALTAIQAGLTPIVCIGETLQEREQNQTEVVIERQMNALFDVVDANLLGRLVIAYEPVWAIGTGMSATAEQAQHVHAFIRGLLSAKTNQSDSMAILYGGSMKPDNAAELLAQEDIDGGLIGGASLKATDFLEIAQQAPIRAE